MQTYYIGILSLFFQIYMLLGMNYNVVTSLKCMESAERPRSYGVLQKDLVYTKFSPSLILPNVDSINKKDLLVEKLSHKCQNKIVNDSEKEYLKNIFMKSAPYMLRKHIPYTVQSLLNSRGVMVERNGMRDPIYMDSIITLLRPYIHGAKTARKDWFDVRLVCLFSWEIGDQERVDTLSFGWVGMAYNDKYYDIDIPLLRFLSHKLPSDYIQDVERFIQLFPEGRYEE